MITDTLTYPEQLAREKQFVESWNTVLKSITAEYRCFITTESRVQKSAYIYRRLDGHKLGRIWVNFSGVTCYEVNHLAVSRNKTYQACHLRQALCEIISYHF